VLVEDGEALRTMALYIDLNPVRAGLVEDPKDYRWTGYGEATGGSKRARRGLCKVMEAPLDSWEERRGELTPAEAYRCWLFGEGLEAGRAEENAGGDAAGGDAGVERSGLEATGGLKFDRGIENEVAVHLRVAPVAVPVTVSSKVTPRSRTGFSKERVEAVLRSGGKLSRSELLRCRVRWFSDGVAIGSKSFVEGVFTTCRQHFGAKRKDGARKLREDAGDLHALRELRRRAVL
jgi:hypothetical protein